MNVWKKITPLFLVLVLTLSVSLSSFAEEQQFSRTIAIIKTEGDKIVLTKGTDKEFAAKNGTKLSNGYTLATGASSFAYLGMDGDTVTKLDSSSKIDVSKSDGKKLKLSLLSGAITVNAGKQTDGNVIEVKTGNTVMGIRGTIFTIITHGDQIIYTVYEGSVIIDTPKGTRTIDAGFRAIVDKTTDDKTEAAEKTLEIETKVSITPIAIENLETPELKAIKDNFEVLVQEGAFKTEDSAKIEQLITKHVEEEKLIKIADKNLLDQQIASINKIKEGQADGVAQFYVDRNITTDVTSKDGKDSTTTPPSTTPSSFQVIFTYTDPIDGTLKTITSTVANGELPTFPPHLGKVGYVVKWEILPSPASLFAPVSFNGPMRAVAVSTPQTIDSSTPITQNMKVQLVYAQDTTQDGTSSNPYKLTKENFKHFALKQMVDSTIIGAMGKHYLLTEDIDIADYGITNWTPIANFSGRFFSSGAPMRTISNLNISDPSATGFGMFSTLLSGAEIHKIIFSGASVNVYQSGGVVAGIINSGATIKDCVVVSSSVQTSNDFAGGIAGNNAGDIVYCNVKSSNISGNSVVGGVVGSNSSLLSESNSIGNAIYATASSGGHHFGGVAGNSTNTIDLCFSSSTVSVGSNMQVGGIVGQTTSSVSSCANVGAVSGGDSVGGIVGSLQNSVTNCYSNANVNGQTGVGGIVGSDTSMTPTSIKNNFSKYSVGASSSRAGGIVGESTGSSTTIQYNIAMNSTITSLSDVNKIIGFNNAANILDNMASADIQVTPSDPTATDAVNGGNAANTIFSNFKIQTNWDALNFIFGDSPFNWNDTNSMPYINFHDETGAVINEAKFAW